MGFAELNDVKNVGEMVWMIAKNPVSCRILGGGFASHVLINVHSPYVF